MNFLMKKNNVDTLVAVEIQKMEMKMLIYRSTLRCYVLL